MASCSRCGALMNKTNIQRHWRKVHGLAAVALQNRKTSSIERKSRQIKTNRSATNKRKQVPLATCRSLATDLAAYWPKYLLQLVRNKGIKITSTSSPIPARIVDRKSVV